MLLASINYTLSLGFALTFLLAGIGITSIFHAFRTLLGLEIAAGPLPPVHSGEPAQFGLVLSHHRHTAREAIVVRTAHSTVALDLPPDTHTPLTLSAPTPARGWQRVGRITIETVFPLGLIRAWSVLTPDLALLVYPTPETSAPPPPNAAGSAGRTHASSGDDDFAGLRAHRPTDSPRQIAWKAVARSGTLVAKQFQGGAGGLLIFDWHQLPAALPGEARLQRLARWVVDAARDDARWTLRLPGQTLGPDRGAQHRHRCLRALALFRLNDHAQATD
ncbi:MAG: DUF58 domain-containing protein [Proteobacteria bacterium]|nr:MAG: DUF58 domain-containing protein [Pseudomonadota bacterium]